MAQSIHQRRVKDEMSRDVVTLDPEDKINDALELLVANRVTALPVVDKRKNCIGILSTSDLIDLTREIDDEDLDTSSRRWLVDKLLKSVGQDKVGSYMTENVATVGAESTLYAAAQEMVRNRVHRLPVVDHHGQLAGIISTMDILSAFAESEGQ